MNEGRYHASACIVQDRYIYVFGGYRTKKLTGDYTTSKINRTNEVMANVTNGRIERYDTSKAVEMKANVKKGNFPQTSSGTDEDAVNQMIDNMELWPTFDVINIKRDPVNDVGQLVVFPLSSYWQIRKNAHEVRKQGSNEDDDGKETQASEKDPSEAGDMLKLQPTNGKLSHKQQQYQQYLQSLQHAGESHQIAISGGLTAGELAGKGHIFDTGRSVVNSVPDLCMPNADIVRVAYNVQLKDKIFAVGQNKVHEYNQTTRKWRICGQGISVIKQQEWDFDFGQSPAVDRP